MVNSGFNDASSLQKISLEEARSYIEQLDLTYISAAMCSTRYPLPRWTHSDVEHCLQLYKNFLILLKKHPSERLVPTREIDEFWHNHILYTKRYTEDCQHIFGYYLHHYPAAPQDDMQQLATDYLKTKQYYLEEFKQPLSLISRRAA